jgi:hypothetical protein
MLYNQHYIGLQITKGGDLNIIRLRRPSDMSHYQSLMLLIGKDFLAYY